MLGTVGINSFGLQVLQLRGRLRELNWIYLAGVSIGCLTAAVLGPIQGMIGIATTVAGAKFLVAAGSYFVARPFIKSFTWAFFMRIAGACAVMALVLLAFGPNHSVWLRIAVGAAAYITIIIIMFRHLLRLLSHSVRR